jgi:hypothetical protein
LRLGRTYKNYSARGTDGSCKSGGERMSDIKEGRKYKVAFEYHFSDFDEVIWNGNEWYFNTIPEIKRFLAKYDKHCKIKMAEIKLIETNESVGLRHFDTEAAQGTLVFKEVIK